MGLSAGALDDLALSRTSTTREDRIPDAILQARSAHASGWDMMMAHPEIGARIVGGCYELSISQTPSYPITKGGWHGIS